MRKIQSGVIFRYITGLPDSLQFAYQNPNFGIHKASEYFLFGIGSSWAYGIFYGYLADFLAIWYILKSHVVLFFPRFAMLYQEETSNLVLIEQ
jgi:hypothetical protein